MAIDKITNESINDNGIATTKIVDNPQFEGTGSILIPAGTTAERPSSPVVGQLRYNTDTGNLEQFNGNWVAIEPSPVANSISPTTIDGNSGTTITVNGSNFKSGAVVAFIPNGSSNAVNASTTTFVSSTQITAVLPRDFTVSEEPLSIRVTNPTGLSTELVDVLDLGSSPTWTTAAGNIATFTTAGYSSSSSPAVAATDPDGGPVTYALTSGAVPAGTTWDANTQIVSGEPTAIDAATTSSFDITATDNAGNNTVRSFNIITNPTLDGTTAARANASALRIIKAVEDAGGTASDWQALEGPLWLKPAYFAGTNTNQSAFRVWCDMNTQGGGWTLLIKFDHNQATASAGGYGLGTIGGRGYNNTSEGYSLDATGSKLYCIDARDIMNYDRALTHNSNQYGGRYMMHACTNKTSGVSRSSYTAHNFSGSVVGNSVSLDGSTSVSHSPIFSQFHKNMYNGSQTSQLWQTNHSSITNNGGSANTGLIQDYASSSDITTYGGGIFYALGTDRKTAPANHNSYIDVNAGYDNHSQAATPNGVARQDHADGNQMFSCVNREGSVYCSGTNQTAVTGHNSPKFNWGWVSADGTGQTYGMGDYAIGTACNVGFTGAAGSNNQVPAKRMNYMFIR